MHQLGHATEPMSCSATRLVDVMGRKVEPVEGGEPDMMKEVRESLRKSFAKRFDKYLKPIVDDDGGVCVHPLLRAALFDTHPDALSWLTPAQLKQVQDAAATDHATLLQRRCRALCTCPCSRCRSRRSARCTWACRATSRRTSTGRRPPPRSLAC